MMRRLGGALIVVLAVCWVSASPRPQDERTYDDPIDAISLGFTKKTDALEVSGFDGTTWSAWTPVAVEDEQDPALLESNLVVFPHVVSRVRFRGTARNYVDHPIRVAHDGMRLEVAAVGQVPEPTIYARSSWGADETLRYSDSVTSAPSQEGDAAQVPSDSDTLTDREKTCLEAQKDYPLEFRTSRTISTQGGKDLRWPLQYSSSVKLLVVHHTAQNLEDDARSGPELMRALYQYHAVNRGWGDIGYNFVIDPQGKIYEGRAGGSSVVAGHAYCNNIGTVGIALMGNYEVSTPPMEQIKSLQWLIGKLSDSYNIDLSKSVTYHGIDHAAVVGHRDLLSTECPGYYLYGTIGQMLTNVRNGDWTASVRFPVPRSSSSSSRRSYSARSSTSSVSTPRLPDTPAAGTEDTVVPVGETQIVGRPSQVFNFSVQYTAGKAYRSGTRIADVSLSPASMLLWQERDGRMIRIHSALVLPFDLRKGQTARLQLRIQVPDDEGTYSFIIGDVSYAIRAEGRRVPTPILRSSSSSSTSRSAPRSEVLPTTPRPYVPRSSSSASSSRAASSLPSTYQQAPALPSSTIRIRLTLTAGTATLTAPKGAAVGDSISDGSPITLLKDGDTCSADQSGHNLAFGTLRIDAGGSPVGLSHGKVSRHYRGSIECRVYDNALTIINEVPVEDYMAGIGEEPDTELYEKQRAFAIAARSYAVYYMSPDHRKFPGAPYDGSDNPADFQLYVGSDNETANPRWVKAVQDTVLQVGVIDGGVVRLPYFSSDDGRTRAPEEAGWKNFPHASVFASKEDPWCKGESLRGHGVGMSGCGAKGQAADGKSAETILGYYYPGVTLQKLRSVVADR